MDAMIREAHGPATLTRSLWARGILVLGLLVVGYAPTAEAAKDAGRPNIVVIVSDDLDYGKLGYTGYQVVQTPHIDSIIRGGTFFAAGYVSSPVCAPSRAGLMTGRYQARIGYETFTGRITRQIAQDYGVDTREILIPELLKDRGYATAVIGKWHLGYNDKYHPNQRGADYFFGFLSGGHDYFVWDSPIDSEAGGPILRNNEKAAGEGYITEAMAREAAGFVRKHRKRPFFLYYAPLNVHAPRVVPDKYLPPSGDVTAGMVKALDDSVGVILEALRGSGRLKNTLIVFVNDNGGMGENTPFRGGKAFLHEGGIRVPFAMSWPGHIPAGSVYDRPVIQLDILPTVVAAAGGNLPTDREYDGVDLLPYLTGQRTTDPHEYLFWRYPGRGRAVRAGDLKLLLPENGPPELYDLKNDPGEQHNLASEQPQAVGRLTRAIGAWESTVEHPRQYGLKSD